MRYKRTNTPSDLTPPEYLVADEIIVKTSAAIDADLPPEALVTGCLIYNSDYSIIKHRGIDGLWKEVQV